MCLCRFIMLIFLLIVMHILFHSLHKHAKEVNNLWTKSLFIIFNESQHNSKIFFAHTIILIQCRMNFSQACLAHDSSQIWKEHGIKIQYYLKNVIVHYRMFKVVSLRHVYEPYTRETHRLRIIDRCVLAIDNLCSHNAHDYRIFRWCYMINREI